MAISRKPVSAKPQVTRNMARGRSSCGRLPFLTSIGTALPSRGSVDEIECACWRVSQKCVGEQIARLRPAKIRKISRQENQALRLTVSGQKIVEAKPAMSVSKVMSLPDDGPPIC